MTNLSDTTYFTFSREDSKKIMDWQIKHAATCKYTGNVGAIGGVLTYTFTPTNLGTVVKAVCACGEEIDVSNYDEW